MNTKRFLVMAVLVVLSLSLLTVAATTKPAPVRAQVQADAPKLVLLNEPAVKMQSGVIWFSDNNFPDFRPHFKVPVRLEVSEVCMSDENAHLRRWGGCIQ